MSLASTQCSVLWNQAKERYVNNKETTEWLYKEWVGHKTTCQGTGGYELNMASILYNMGKSKDAVAVLENVLIAYEGPLVFELRLAHFDYTIMAPAEMSQNVSREEWLKILAQLKQIHAHYGNDTPFALSRYYSKLAGIYFHLGKYDKAYHFSKKSVNYYASEYAFVSLIKSAAILGKYRESIYVMNEGVKRYKGLFERVDVLMFASRAAVKIDDMQGATIMMTKILHLNRELIGDDFFQETFSGLKEIANKKAKTKEYIRLEGLMDQSGV